MPPDTGIAPNVKLAISSSLYKIFPRLMNNLLTFSAMLTHLINNNNYDNLYGAVIMT